MESHPFSRDLPDRGIELRSSALQVESLLSEPPGKRADLCINDFQFSLV